MKYVLNNIEYDIIINRKNNKHTYVRIDRYNNICVNTNYFVSKRSILNMLKQNEEFLIKAINKNNLKQIKNKEFYYLNKKYDIVYNENIDIIIKEDKIIVKSEEYLNKWLNKEIKKLFQERLDYNYNLFKEDIPYPKLKIRKMKTRWGVCNKKNITVTLNSELIRYGIEELDYVIIHELSHFVYFDHSKQFWNEVSKYCKDYKIIRKRLNS